MMHHFNEISKICDKNIKIFSYGTKRIHIIWEGTKIMRKWYRNGVKSKQLNDTWDEIFSKEGCTSTFLYNANET
jgi:hypothetical protein